MSTSFSLHVSKTKIDDFAIRTVYTFDTVYRQIPIYRKFWYIDMNEKLIPINRYIGFNTDIFGISVYRTFLTHLHIKQYYIIYISNNYFNTHLHIN
jgi:hypothetical protein